MSRADELYKDVSLVFIEKGIGSADFAKLAELYRYADKAIKLRFIHRELNRLIDEAEDETQYPMSELEEEKLKSKIAAYYEVLNLFLTEPPKEATE